MRIKTSELSGAALDWAVAKCEGYDICGLRKGGVRIVEFDGFGLFSPSKWWRDGGPILEREGIHLICNDDLTEWTASFPRKNLVGWRLISLGPTALIAAMRCYVASKLGEYVGVPDEMKS